MKLFNSRVKTPDFQPIGWRYYNKIKKKAVEQEFSWSGLILSLSIAFFIVVASAEGLNLVYQSITQAIPNNQSAAGNIYLLEKQNYLNMEIVNFISMPIKNSDLG